MKRSALIIESSNVKINGWSIGDLPGARKDVDLWWTYLRREMAGAWERHEIEIMHKPRAENVINFINQHKNDDYCFVIYTGHGGEFKNSKKAVPHVLLNDKDCFVDIKHLLPQSSKGILISDACRSSMELDSSFLKSTYGFNVCGAVSTCNLGAMYSGISILSAARDKFKDLENYFDFFSPLDFFSPITSIRAYFRRMTREKYQRTWFEFLDNHSKGVTTIFSSSSGEASEDDKDNGGVYLTALLSAIKEWHEFENKIELTTYEAHCRAADKLGLAKYSQHPEYLNPKVNFPIAVKIL